MSESFSVLPLQTQILAYPYMQYSDDPNIVAFFTAFNQIAQGYLDWFNSTPLSIYTNPTISGPLLDWVLNGLYGIERPVISTFSSAIYAGYGSGPSYGTSFYGGFEYVSSGTALIATDDIYKRVATWHLYQGDGQQFSMQWLKNRVSRFLNGANGSDWPVLNNPPNITVSASEFTITLASSDIADTFAECAANNILALPFMNTFNVVT